MDELDSQSGSGSQPIITRAAQYVRMSTEHQQYSTENQADKIIEYAARRNIEIVKTYADEGKSGLKIAGRQGLQELIRDVQAGNVDFSVILVYDVSRWGRFQDADESAYYEYICKRAGIQVLYCAEQFENDGSPVSTIVKGVKRAMAGEYSRELSAKVFAGQCRLIELGFRQGGPAGFGLRRMLIAQNGEPKGLLKRGEHKSLQTDRVILVPGPDDEVRLVVQIYTWFVESGWSESFIAQHLNEQGIYGEDGRPWSKSTVHEVLTNPKYIGDNVYNRVSFKLKKQRVVNSEQMWIRKPGAFEGIVEPALFYTAQGIIRARSIRFSDEEMLDMLRRLYKQHGYLSGFLINETAELPSAASFSNRFGGLSRAYQAVGFDPGRDYAYLEINRRLREMHPQIVKSVQEQIVALGGQIRMDPHSDLMNINGEFTASIVLSRCHLLSSSKPRWKVRLDAGLKPDITIAVRMDIENASALDYFLLPLDELKVPKVALAARNAVELESFRFDDLNFFFRMAERYKLRRVA